MKVNLGINTCFALKRWPRPADWASVVRNDLGLDLVELSLDLVEGIETFAGSRDAVERSTCSCIPTRRGVLPQCSGTAPSST